MATLWTPGGERKVGTATAPDSAEEGGFVTPTGVAAGQEDMDEKRLRELEDQLAATPAEVIVANHGYGMFELAALHLGRRPPQLDQARLAIDALGALVETLQGRLGQHEQQLRDGLAQIQLAFVQIRAAEDHTP